MTTRELLSPAGGSLTRAPYAHDLAARIELGLGGVAQEHWCSSGFANTDLNLQLKKHSIHKLIVVGLVAHTCARHQHSELRTAVTTDKVVRAISRV